MEIPSGSGIGTRAIHAGQVPDPSTGAIMTPIFQSSTFVQEAPGVHKGYDYSRSGNPTRQALEDNIASLESAKHGLCFASGCAATSAIISCLDSGDHIIASDDMYGGTFRVFTKVFARHGFEFSFVDMRNPDNVAAAITKNTKLIWTETPTNPMMKLTDIKAICEIGSAKGVPVAVDNTFATPILQSPMALGATFVVHSTTKYLGGHSDVVGGAIALNDDEWRQRLAFVQKSVGGTPGPFDCFLQLRGIKTLHVRVERHCDNAERIAKMLEEHKEVEKVYYPGLESHAQFDLARKQMCRSGGMLSFVVKGGLEKATQVMKSTKIFALAESLGGVESLIEHPGIMTHASMPKETRDSIGIVDGLIRVSVGIEDIADLEADLLQALAARIS